VTSDVKSRALGGILLIAIAWLPYRALASMAHLGERHLILLARDAGLTLLRLNAALLLGALCWPSLDRDNASRGKNRPLSCSDCCARSGGDRRTSETVGSAVYTVHRTARRPQFHME
jgi:hypothetical protein